MGCNISHSNDIDDDSHGSISYQEQSSLDKIHVDVSTNILIVGDNRVKVATSCVLKQMAKDYNRELVINICTRAPNNTQMGILKKDGINVYEGEMVDTSSITKVIKKCHPDTIFIVTPSTIARVTETVSLIQQCKRSGVGHVILLSNTIVESSKLSIFGEQFIQIERFLLASGLSYTIVRIPIYMDNYLSQLDSIATYGIFYQPLTPFCNYSAIAIIDVADVVAKILLNPGNYSDKIITLNGPLACGNSAADAFSIAIGKTVSYEQISYESFKECLVMSKMHEWQVNGTLELFQMYEETNDFNNTSSSLYDLLGRPPTDILALAHAAVADTGLNNEVKISPRGTYPFNIRAIKFSPQFNQYPAGCIGILRVTMILLKSKKLKSSLKSTSNLSSFNNEAYRSTKKKGVRFVSEENTDISEMDDPETPKNIHPNDENTKHSTSNPTSSSNSSVQASDVGISLDAIRPDIHIDVSNTDENSSFDNPIIRRERFNSADSSDGSFNESRNSYDPSGSPKIIFGKNIQNFKHEEDILEQLDNKEYVTLHLKSKFVILLEGNLTFIPSHAFVSSITLSGTPQASQAGTPVQSGKKQFSGSLATQSPSSSGKKLFGSLTPQMSLGKSLGKKSIDNNLGIIGANEGSNTPPSPVKGTVPSNASTPNSTGSSYTSPSQQVPRLSATKTFEEKSFSMVTRTLGSVENKSFLLQGYTVRTDPQNPLRIIINGLKKTGKIFFLDTANEEEHDRWMKCLISHVEFEVNKFDNVDTWIM